MVRSGRSTNPTPSVRPTRPDGTSGSRLARRARRPKRSSRRPSGSTRSSSRTSSASARCRRSTSSTRTSTSWSTPLQRTDDPLKAELGLLDVVIGKTFLLTQHREGPATGRLLERFQRNPALLEKGPAWLAHAFIDGVVDRYEPYMNTLRQRIDAVEEHVLMRAGLVEGKDLLPELFALRRVIQTLRRSTHHQREILQRLSQHRHPADPGDCRLYFRDVYDHFTRVDEHAEDYMDAVTSLVDAYLTVQSNRMNDTVKRLTLMSTVLLPLNFIASFYGMNFKSMPELSWSWGREFALAQMVLLALLIWGWFKRKKWV